MLDIFDLRLWTCFSNAMSPYSVFLFSICQYGCFQHYLFQYLIKLGEILNSDSTLFQNLTFSLNFEYSAGNIGNILNGAQNTKERWQLIGYHYPLCFGCGFALSCVELNELCFFSWVGTSCVISVVLWSDCCDTVTMQKSKCWWWFVWIYLVAHCNVNIARGTTDPGHWVYNLNHVYH